MYTVTYYRSRRVFATLEEAIIYAQGCGWMAVRYGRGNAAKAARVRGPNINILVRAGVTK